MAYKILMINQGDALMTDTLETALHKNGIVTVCVEPETENIRHEKNDSDMILLLAGDYINNVPDTFAYLKDICINNDKKLSVIGHNEEMDIIEKIIPRSAVTHFFELPADMNVIADELKAMSDTEEKRKKGKHILLVDDDLTFLKVMQAWLSVSYRISAVRSGMQAINYLKKHTPDLILLDYDMPVMEGAEILELIRKGETSASIPVIFLTGKSDSESIDKVMKLHPDGYLLKSMGKEDILEAVEKFFADQNP